MGIDRESVDHGYRLGLADIDAGRGYDHNADMDAPLDVLRGYQDAWRIHAPDADTRPPRAWTDQDEAAIQAGSDEDDR